MAKFILVGDVHGDIGLCKRIAAANPKSIVLQIGDFGVGFIPTYELNYRIPKNLKFFCGNHDCRQKANLLPYCLGDFGEYQGLFFVSGADSIDKHMRTEGISWWADEELSYEQCEQALEAWTKSSCDVLVAHDCPQNIMDKYYPYHEKCRTRALLEAMVKARKPRLFVYGHHHVSMRMFDDGVQYMGLNIAEEYKLDTDTPTIISEYKPDIIRITKDIAKEFRLDV